MCSEDIKNEQRALALAARRSLSNVQRAKASREICMTILELPSVKRARVVLCYRAFDCEADLSALEEALISSGKRVAYPRCCENGNMEAWIPESGDSFQPGMYGVLEPVPTLSEHVSPERIDAVIVPCVAFDAEKGRLGHGDGWYDRYLPRCVNATKIMAAFEAQRLERVERDELDVATDAAVTEKGVY